MISSKTEFLYFNGFSRQSRNEDGLFSWYQFLCQLRKDNPALTSNEMQEVKVEPDQTVYAFHRWQEQPPVFGIMNLARNVVTATITLPLQRLAFDSVLSHQSEGWVLCERRIEPPPRTHPGFTSLKPLNFAKRKK